MEFPFGNSGLCGTLGCALWGCAEIQPVRPCRTGMEFPFGNSRLCGTLGLRQYGAVLRFSLFRIPITVRGSFLLIAALLGLSGRRDPVFIASWVVIVFVSILIHEFGHAFTARSLGAEVAIELNGIGGLTRWSVPASQYGPGRRALVAFAGSAVGVVFGGIVWLVAAQFGPYSGVTAFVISNLIFVNVFWGLLNWLPIRPLDGGHLLEAILEKTAPNRADSIARAIFTFTAAAALVAAIRYQLIFIILISGWLLLSEFNIGRTPQPRAPIPPLTYEQPEPEVIDVEPETEQ